MANLMDYLDWRGDLPLAVSPFNEVDNMALCKLSSLDFTGVLPVEGLLPLPEACRLYCEKNGGEDRRQGLLLAPGSLTMLKRMAESARFCGFAAGDYVNHVDSRREEQFSALTVRLPDGTHFIVFRGTDDHIVAWKEDFNMGSQDAVPAQADAAAYLLRAAWRYEGPLRVGGHSKGGNLAVYAAMHAPPALQERILEVYNNDGPGFRDAVSGHEGYARIRPKLRTLVPQHALVGVLLHTEDDFEIVESSETGLAAHNGFTWQVKGTRFVRCAEFSLRSRIFREAVRGWAASLTLEERRALTDAVFDALAATGADTLTDLTEQKARKAVEAAQDLLGEAEQRELFADSMELLVKEYLTSARHALPLGRFRRRKREDE